MQASHTATPINPHPPMCGVTLRVVRMVPDINTSCIPTCVGWHWDTFAYALTPKFVRVTTCIIQVKGQGWHL